MRGTLRVVGYVCVAAVLSVAAAWVSTPIAAQGDDIQGVVNGPVGPEGS